MMSDLNAFLYPVVDKLPLEYRSLSSISVAMSPYDWEEARKKYAAYELLVDACKKSALAFDLFFRAVPPDVEPTRGEVMKWKKEIDAANQTAIDALYKALLAVEEIG